MLAGDELAEQVGDVSWRFLGHEVPGIDRVVGQVRRPRAPARGGIPYLSRLLRTANNGLPASVTWPIGTTRASTSGWPAARQ